MVTGSHGWNGVIEFGEFRLAETKPDALAWCFPGITRDLRPAKKEHEGYVFPGVILALKVADNG